MTMDIKVPCVFVVLFSRTESPPIITVAAAAHPDPIKACVKALDEAVSTRRYCVLQLIKGIEKPNFNDFSMIRTLEDHLVLYAYPEMTEAFNFLLNSKRYVTLSDLPRYSKGSPNLPSK